MPLSIIATNVAVCSVSVGALCGADFPNPVVNGDFETGDLTGWTLACPDGGCAVEPDPWGFNGQFRRTAVSASPAALSQVLNLNHGLYAVDFSIQDSTIPFDPASNTIDIKAGKQTFRLNILDHSFGRSLIFDADAGLSDLVFTFNAANGSGSLTLDHVVGIQLDDGGAAHATASAVAAAQTGMRQFIGTIFSGSGSGATGFASRALPTTVAGPATVRSAKTHAWFSGGYSDARWDSSDTRASGGTFSVGIDGVIDDGWSAGLAAAFSERRLTSQGEISRIEGEGHSQSAAIYARYTPGDDPFYAQAAIGGGRSKRDQSRYNNTAFETYAVDDIGGSHWFAAAEGGYRMAIDSSGSVTPYIRLMGGRAHDDGYSEAETWYWIGGVIVDRATQDSLASEIGFRAHLSGILDDCIDLGLHVAWRHEFLDPNGIDYSIDEIGRSRFFMSLPGLATGRDAAMLGINAEATLWDQTSIFVRYDGEAGDGFEAHSGQAGLRTVW